MLIAIVMLFLLRLMVGTLSQNTREMLQYVVQQDQKCCI